MQPETIRNITMQPNRKYFVFGDIHGCHDQFLAVLHHINFNFDCDLAISLGDLVDRGTANLESTTLLNQPWFTMIKGNHEELHQGQFLSHKGNGTLWAEDLLALYSNHPDRIQYQAFLDHIDHLPIAIILDNRYVLIHASLPLICYSSYHTADMDVIQILHDTDYTPRLFDPNPALWSVSHAFSPDVFNFNSVDYIFHGHTIFDTIRQKGNTIFLDTGFMSPTFSQQTVNCLSYATLTSDNPPQLFTASVDFSTNQVLSLTKVPYS
jgi:predicted phosphodiesterase